MEPRWVRAGKDWSMSVQQTSNGPRVRTDIVDLYVVRPGESRGWEVLQVRRTRAPMLGTWQPVMGHIEAGETAVVAVVREAREELGLEISGLAREGWFWQLEQVWAFYIAAMDCVVMSPRFVVRVGRGWEPALNAEHDARRWVALGEAGRWFMWPGQSHALREVEGVLMPGSLAGEHLRLRAV